MFQYMLQCLLYGYLYFPADIIQYESVHIYAEVCVVQRVAASLMGWLRLVGS